MAKIHLRGGHSIEVSQEKAKEINRDWIDKVLPEMVELETESFKSSEIKGIEGVGVSIKDDRHSLDNPRTKEEVKDFEKKYLQYLEDNPKKFNWKNKVFSHLIWFQELGAIKLTGDISKISSIDNMWHFNYKIDNRELFTELQWKFQSWNELRWRRERVKEDSFPMDEIDVSKLGI